VKLPVRSRRKKKKPRFRLSAAFSIHRKELKQSSERHLICQNACHCDLTTFCFRYFIQKLIQVSFPKKRKNISKTRQNSENQRPPLLDVDF
jgi:hypothetical protein